MSLSTTFRRILGLLKPHTARMVVALCAMVVTAATEPAVAGNAAGFWVAWTNKVVEESQADKGVALQRFDLSGQPVGEQIGRAHV